LLGELQSRSFGRRSTTTVAAEKTLTIEGIRIPDSRLAREITQFVRDTESALLFHHSSRRTVGSYWPYAPTLFDYIRRAMPQNAPQSLSNEDVYAVSAYILNLNGLLPADATLDAKTLSAVKMPNRNMFVGDPRPDVKNPACMTGC
jgi:hypothetical protein